MKAGLSLYAASLLLELPGALPPLVLSILLIAIVRRDRARRNGHGPA